MRKKRSGSTLPRAFVYSKPAYLVKRKRRRPWDVGRPRPLVAMTWNEKEVSSYVRANEVSERPTSHVECSERGGSIFLIG